MPESTPRCGDCGVGMEIGFLLEFASHGGPGETVWHPGEPKPMKLLGLTVGVDFDWDQAIVVTSYRCTKCGLLKSYARSAGGGNPPA
jgi:hypothetical protein